MLHTFSAYCLELQLKWEELESEYSLKKKVTKEPYTRKKVNMPVFKM